MEREALPPADRRHPAGLGFFGHERGSQGAVRGRLSRRAGGQDAGVEAGERVQGEERGDAEEVRSASRHEEKLATKTRRHEENGHETTKTRKHETTKDA